MMLLLIPLLPLAGFLVNAFFGRRLPKSISGGVACLAMVASFAISAGLVWGLRGEGAAALETTAFEWIGSGKSRSRCGSIISPR
jgi:NADH-quinone oxidoreductase subunit L